MHGDDPEEGMRCISTVDGGALSGCSLKFAGTAFSEVGAREEGPEQPGPSSSQRFGLGALSDVARVVVNHSCARALIDHRSMHDARVLHRTLAHVLDHRSVHDARVVLDYG